MAGEVLVEVYADTKGHGRCRSCDASIVWFETIAGKRMPFNGDPAFSGDPVPRRGRDDKTTGRLVEAYSSDDVHWRTCPVANKWRKKR